MAAARTSSTTFTDASIPDPITLTSKGNAEHCDATAFDRPHYLALNKTRGETIRQLLATVRPVLKLTTALDAGCGLGFFSALLEEAGLAVKGFDGRLENVIEARRRFPRIPFAERDIEDRGIVELGEFDLVLCFGLLYHLENPMRAIRHLRALTGSGLLLESMCVPGSGSTMMLREEPRQEDQSLTDTAVYPTETCLVKMLYRAGFATVYRVSVMPDHDDFRESEWSERRRTVLFAAAIPIHAPGLELLIEPREEKDPWSRADAMPVQRSLSWRARRFVRRPVKEKYFSLVRKARRILPDLPIVLRLPFGAWWLASETSALDQALVGGEFERAEMRFVEKLLRPGMTVLDVGAHHGLYTLLAAKSVGRTGRVVAFEPSLRERKRLVRHLRVNRCGNVRVAPYALGENAGDAELFVVKGRHDWCNSLRPPDVDERTCTVRVEVQRLDDVLEKLEIGRVDFVKLDVEGAELEVLYGAVKLLKGEARPTRPVIMVEVQDLRTRPWGYRAREIVRWLAAMGYRWFQIDSEGRLEVAPIELERYDANLVAIAEERVAQFSNLMNHGAATIGSSMNVI
jgi:FkbM family methyltransferase